MPRESVQIAELKEQIQRLQSEITSLSQSFYKNNFANTQTFNKDVIFQTRLKVPSYGTPPSVGEVGDIIAVAGVLYICTTAGNVSSPAVFTLVGTQA